jgi:hypothetical protein
MQESLFAGHVGITVRRSRRNHALFTGYRGITSIFAGHRGISSIFTGYHGITHCSQVTMESRTVRRSRRNHCSQVTVESLQHSQVTVESLQYSQVTVESLQYSQVTVESLQYSQVTVESLQYSQVTVESPIVHRFSIKPATPRENGRTSNIIPKFHRELGFSLSFGPVEAGTGGRP